MNENKSKIRKFTKQVDGRRMNVVLNVELFKEVECFKYLRSKINIDGGIETSDIGKVWRGMKKVFSCRIIAMNVNRKLYEGVTVSTVLYKSKTWSMAVEKRYYRIYRTIRRLVIQDDPQFSRKKFGFELLSLY